MELKDIYARNAKVVNFVDGDTFDAEGDLGFNVRLNERFRVLGINVPEKYGPTKMAGLKSREYMVETILNKDILLVSSKMDDFRRYLAEVYINNMDGTQSEAGLAEKKLR